MTRPAATPADLDRANRLTPADHALLTLAELAAVLRCGTKEAAAHGFPCIAVARQVLYPWWLVRREIERRAVGERPVRVAG